MKKFILLVLFPIYTLLIHAQQFTVEGWVCDEQQAPIGYASVALLASDSITLITGTISDDQGRFTLREVAEGDYYISVSFVGYTPFAEAARITADTKLTCVLTDGIALDEVTVSADRSNVVRQSAVGQTFMLSATAAKKKDVMDALQEIPALSVDPATRKLSMSDGSNPLILINGVRREGGLSAISPEDVLSVEVVPTASAEFMREGYTSVVNIRVKKSDKRYYTFNGGFTTHPLVLFGVGDASLEIGNSISSLYLTGQSFGFVNNKSELTEITRTALIFVTYATTEKLTIGIRR